MKRMIQTAAPVAVIPTLIKRNPKKKRVKVRKKREKASRERVIRSWWAVNKNTKVFLR